jgi:ribosomal protein L3 glutamine methyltransferase
MNVRRYKSEDRITLAQGDLFDAIQPKSAATAHRSGPLRPHEGAHKPFDLIICNPPYVPRVKRKRLPKEFLHEPEMALLADDHGMALVQRVIADAARHLTPHGLLVIEIGHERAACEAMMARHFPGLEPLWIETAEQSDNVFLLHASQLHSFFRRPKQ